MSLLMSPGRAEAPPAQLNPGPGGDRHSPPYSHRCSCSRCWWPERPSPPPSCGSAAAARGAGGGHISMGGHGGTAGGPWGLRTLTSFTTYFSRFSNVFSFKQPCGRDGRAGWGGGASPAPSASPPPEEHPTWAGGAHGTHREVHAVHGLAHVLEHAAEGHEEVPVLVAGVTAAAVGKNWGG